jgi:hypothetical protein
MDTNQDLYISMNGPREAAPPYWIMRDESLELISPSELLLGGATCLTAGGVICSS